MSSTVEDAEAVARRMERAMSYPDRVRVEVRAGRLGGLVVPSPDGDDVESAVFRVLTYGDNYVMEMACRRRVEGDDGEEGYEVDVNEIRRMIVKRNLLSWTLDVPIDRVDGWMTPECYSRVGRVASPLVEAFLDAFEDETMVTLEEEVELKRQAAVLFSPRGHGVADACEAVSLFCTLGNYYEKFGLDRDRLWELPYREYLLLKMMIRQEGEARQREESRHKTSAHSGTKIVAGHGGRARPSRGIVRSM